MNTRIVEDILYSFEQRSERIRNSVFVYLVRGEKNTAGFSDNEEGHTDSIKLKTMEDIDNNDDQIWNAISDNIKKLRKKDKLSINALSAKTGFTKSYLSHIENCRRKPTISALIRIAGALNVNISYLLGEDNSMNNEDESIVVVKKEDRQHIKSPFRSDNTYHESINYKMKGRLMEGYIVTPSFDFPDEPSAHDGQELVFILKGRQELIYEGKSRILEEGDCCHFDSSKSHLVRSIGKEISQALVVYATKATSSDEVGEKK